MNLVDNVLYMLLGTRSPKDSFGAKSPCFGSNFCTKFVKSPHFVVAEREVVISHKGLSALIL